MSEEKAQAFWAPRTATIRFPLSMRLARSQRERLWKGLERFVNCRDDLGEYQALGRAFPDFWPIAIWHYPNYARPLTLGRILPPQEPEQSRGEWHKTVEAESVAWHSACHSLFLFYRDTLRQVWSGEPWAGRSHAGHRRRTSRGWWMGGCAAEFLLDLTDFNAEAREVANNEKIHSGIVCPFALDHVWQEILSQFPSAVVEASVQVGMLWKTGEFTVRAQNDFQKAFYTLFRQSWRARVCPRCKMYFVARKQKQMFCGTGCSGGSRLASKRKWWNRIGAKRRTRQRQLASKRRRRERTHR